MNTNKQEVSNIARREEEMLAFWREHNVFEKSVETPAGEAPVGDFVFYDGPPFATGLPHYGHILAGTMKDAIPRFWTMNGYRVRRKWGWDCHGLPIENIIEKKLGLATKRDIEEMGVKKFNETARVAVMEYADDWKKIVPRMGRFVDMEDDYRTMDASYTESVWSVFSKLNEKGLVYEGFKSMHLCPRCGTTLSNFEVNQGYKDIKDIAVTVKMPLVDEPDTSILIWTTTPWTLPGNIAVAVHSELEYVKVKVTLEGKEEVVILAKERLAQLGTEECEILEEMKGSALVGKSYLPPFEYLKNEIEDANNAFKVWHADYVEIGEEGTGAVHLAPAYGEEDMELAKANNVPIVHHVNSDGRFMDFVTPFAGKLVKPKDDDDSGVTHLESDIEIVKALKENGRLFKKENITHSYPHCWRCDTPLLNYATTSWFVKVPDIKDELVEENSQAKWVPEHVGKNRFGKWLEGARDWAISRQRYWGAPLPIWKNPTTGEYKVFGSLKDLQSYVPKSGNTYFTIRHGEAESNLSSFVSTNVKTEDHLTNQGVEQVQEAVVSLKDKKIDLIITSPFNRTLSTTEIIRDGLGLSEEQVIVDERIQEIQISSEWQGKKWADHHAEFNSYEEQFSRCLGEGCETRVDVQKRVASLLYEVEEKYKDKNILFVGHVSSLYALACAAEGANQKRAVQIHDTNEFWLKNAEVRELPFVPMPHNDNYKLDFHRPYIDDIELFDEDGTKLERVPDVFDCWFESGSMPYGQQHYPFENLEVFNPEKKVGYPAQFIAEGLDQTRGWFYSMLVLGTALFGKAPFENVIVNGTILAEDGRKMSKSLQNYPDPMELANRTGVDALRLYLLSSPVVKGEDFNLIEKDVEDIQKKNIGRLHNVLAMYEMFADGTEGANTSKHVLDRWIIARLNGVIKEVTDGYKHYELDKATRPLEGLIDDLSVWYLRRSRDRLKGQDDADKIAALGTLRFVLRELSKVMAPVMPFYAEYLYQAVKKESDSESVHLSKWPEGGDTHTELTTDMEEVRGLVTTALQERTKAGVKVRQPLQKLSIKSDHLNEELIPLIKDELNVKEVVSDTSIEGDVLLDVALTPELKKEGDVREIMRAIQDKRKSLNLVPEDKIKLLVSEAARDLITPFEEELTRVTGVAEISLGDVTEGVVGSDGQTYAFDIEKT